MIAAPPISPVSSTDAAALPQELRGAAEAFEAILLRQLLASARAADFGGSDLFGGEGLKNFRAMQDEHFAEIASQSGAFGLAASIERQLEAHLPNAGEGSE